MKERLIEGLLSAVCAAYYDTRRNPVCRIFIPGDGRMFNKFEKTFREVMTARWQDFLWEYDKEAVKLADSCWLYRYLQYQEIIPVLYDFTLQKAEKRHRESTCRNEKDNRKQKSEFEGWEFLERMLESSERYASECGVGAAVKERVLVFPKKEMLTSAEKKVLGGFYGMIIRSIEDTMEEIMPRVERPCLLEAGMEKEEADQQVLNNLRYQKLKNEELWWHIRYCIDHEIPGCEDLMIGIARNGQWRAWVRQTAVEYACRFMEVGEICEKLLPALNGKLFYWVVSRLAGTREEGLKKQLKRYTACYTGQEMIQDICLVKMQDREGVKRIRRYLEKRKHMPGKMENPDLLLALGEITEVGLLDELEGLVDLMMRDSFKDRSQMGLQVSLVCALSSIAMNGIREREAVWELLERKQKQYEEIHRGVSGMSAEKLVILMNMAEDIRWRTGNPMEAQSGLKEIIPGFPDDFSAIDISSQVREAGGH